MSGEFFVLQTDTEKCSISFSFFFPHFETATFIFWMEIPKKTNTHLFGSTFPCCNCIFCLKKNYIYYFIWSLLPMFGESFVLQADKRKNVPFYILKLPHPLSGWKYIKTKIPTYLGFFPGCNGIFCLKNVLLFQKENFWTADFMFLFLHMSG